MTTSTTPRVSYTHFTSRERVELAAFLRAGHSQKEIARLLGKDSSSISRELFRNSEGGRYDSRLARRKTKERRIQANQRFRKIEHNPELQRYIIAKIQKYWSPEQIAGRLRRRFKKTFVCHETIYQFIYAVCPELERYLRCRKGKYRRRHGTKRREKERRDAEKKRITARPEIVETRERIGDWEGDSFRGTERKQGILVHTERRSGYTYGDKLVPATSAAAAEKTIMRFKKLPYSKRYTITYDNGPECWVWEAIERQMRTKVYYANPYHSWERGTNENTIGLLRQFFPKKTPFATITQEEIEKAVTLLNHRPRKRLSYLTPYEVFVKNCTLD